MHYFHTCRRLPGASPASPTRAPSLDPTKDFRPQTPNLLTPGKNPVTGHYRYTGTKSGDCKMYLERRFPCQGRTVVGRCEGDRTWTL